MSPATWALSVFTTAVLQSRPNLSAFKSTATDRMPYTPPASQSPDVSKSDTPTLTHPRSFSKSQQQNGGVCMPSAKPDLPSSSSSYLHKHRRSPSVPKITSLACSDPVKPTADDIHVNPSVCGKDKILGTKRQRYPTRSILTSGTVISPPESSQNSSDDEVNTNRGRVRELANLAELQQAIRIIEQHRVRSPERTKEETRKARKVLGLDDSSNQQSSPPQESSRSPLTAGARKISHSRSSTEPNAASFNIPPRDKSNVPGRCTSDTAVNEEEKLPILRQSSESEDEEEDFPIRPAMVRKKSGELVRPALRPASGKRRPSSMPGTPTYSKVVHFDQRLEHVRHFLQVDRPLAVSADSSPVESIFYDDSDFPFKDDENEPSSQPFSWEIRLTNFPADTPERKSLPVRVERVYLSDDGRTLVGVVAARNIAFHKLVVARFTLDFWKTTSEVVADYDDDIRRKTAGDGYDRFLFNIKLEDQANLENKTLFFCVRYTVNGQESWDNNNYFNYQVDFSKKAKPQTGKNGMQAKPINPLQRSQPPPTFSSRPLSMPATSADNFSSGLDFSSFPQPCAIAGDSPIRLRNTKGVGDIRLNASSPRTNAAGQAFGNRYDFGASLSATIQASSNGVQSRDDLNLPLEMLTSSSSSSQSDRTDEQIASKVNGYPEKMETKSKGTARPQPPIQDQTKPYALTAEKPSLQSSSYHELLDKYCFVRSQINQDGQRYIY